MLHDPSHIPSNPADADVELNHSDAELLRRLGSELREIAERHVIENKADDWRALNDLKPVRPMVWINEIPWHEMNYDSELTLQCENSWARELETDLRRTIYQSKYMPGDMIVNPWIECQKVFHTTDFGIVEDVEIARTDENSEIYSRHFKVQIKDAEDIKKIKIPKITYLREETERRLTAMQDIFKGIIDVILIGQKHIWFTPWDYLIRWWGVEEAMEDLVLRPDMIHKAYARMVDAWMLELDQFEEQNMLSLDCNNTRIGSGGYGYVTDLPGGDFDPDHVRPYNMWGCSNAQIFSCVSPQMHWEFAVEHDLKWLRRFGLTYYGCCEPLDTKTDILRRIPNLRKISVSAWCDFAKMAEYAGRDFVLSIKPSPAIFCRSSFDAAAVEKQLREIMEQLKGCQIEIIMKDISTVCYKPGQLWEWEKIAMRVAQDYAV